MNLLDYLKDSFITYEVYRKEVNIDSDGYQTSVFKKVSEGKGDLQPTKIDSTATEYGKKILGDDILFTQGDIRVEDEIHIDNKVYKVVSISDYIEYLEVHLEFLS